MEERMLKATELSNCEKVILACIYDYKQKAGEWPDLKAIMQRTSEGYDKTWKPQTVCTFLSRMEKKGLLTSTREGRTSYYKPLLSYENYLEKELDEFCSVFFGGNLKKMKTFVRNL